MSDRISLTLACEAHPLNQALIDGTVVPEGIDLSIVTLPGPKRHWEMGQNESFDVCEFSLGTLLTLHDRGRRLPAIPAYPHRRFRHGSIYVNAAAGIEHPKDLEGRRVGLRTWLTTAGLWARGILQDQYGVDLSSIEWICQDQDSETFDPPEHFRISRAEGQDVGEMLERGELDALIPPDVPASILRGDPRVQRLFPTPETEEISYFRETGFFPLMHVVVLKPSVVESHPDAPRRLLDAFRTSKDLAYRRAVETGEPVQPWGSLGIDEQRAILGEDPWGYEIGSNRQALEQMIRWAHEQGMVRQAFSPDELFVPSIA